MKHLIKVDVKNQSKFISLKLKSENLDYVFNTIFIIIELMPRIFSFYNGKLD